MILGKSTNKIHDKIILNFDMNGTPYKSGIDPHSLDESISEPEANNNQKVTTDVTTDVHTIA